jgi:copper(I)-binding protein
MKSRRLLLYLVLTLLASATAFAQTDEEACNLVYLFDAWARSTVEGAPTGAVFGILVNLGDDPDTLVSASTDVAESVELHETMMGENDVMQMQPIEGGLVVAPDSYLELQPGGFHMMLVDLTEPLVAGNTFHMTLSFEHAGEVEVSVSIRDLDAMDGEMSGGMDMQGMDASAMNAPTMEWSAACATMHLVDAWARPAAAGMPNSAAYALLLNLTDTDETLIRASTEAAEAVELHEVVMGDNDVMQMRPVEGGIVIPAGDATLLQPGGLHIMLINLTAELQVDDTIDMTLTFAESGDIELTVPVREPEEEGMGSGGM